MDVPDSILKSGGKQPCVSVIVAVYNAESYLHRCLDSLLAQTLTNIEILLVNDGSSDNSGVICDEYAKLYPQIKVFHRKNYGVSSTRQFGIEQAKGMYSIHVDPDDWVEPDMLKSCYEEACRCNADMVIFDFIVERKKGSFVCSQQPQSLETSKLLNEMFTTLHGGCCNKLIRHSCYSEYNVAFPCGFSCFEDLYVIASLLRNHLKVCYMPKPFYHYDKYINTNSILRCYTMKSLEEDRNMFLAFSILSETLGPAKICCMQTVTLHMVARAFNSCILNGKQFQQRFAFALPYISSNTRISCFRRWKFCTACQGYYGILSFPQRLFKNICRLKNSCCFLGINVIL